MKAVRWEELRRSARSLENEIDAKLNKFSKLGASFGVQKPNVPNRFISNVAENESPVYTFETLDKQLTDLLEKYGASPSTVAGPLSQQHTMKRHHEILRDYSQDFKTMRNNIINLKNKEDLLGSVYRDMAAKESIALGNTNNRSTTILLEEQRAHEESSRLLDEHIGAAQGMQAALRMQRKIFKGASQRINSLSQRFPVIATVINKINWRKRKDTFIIGGVIGICIFILLIYLFH